MEYIYYLAKEWIYLQGNIETPTSFIIMVFGNQKLNSIEARSRQGIPVCLLHGISYLKWQHRQSKFYQQAHQSFRVENELVARNVFVSVTHIMKTNMEQIPSNAKHCSLKYE